ncbi:MAG: adenosine-specific kinase [Thermoplasmatota archaeon]
MQMEIVEIEKPQDINFILGQTHFIKSVEDIYEAMVTSVPQAKFGIAFCEASGSCKIRSEGNDNDLKKIAENNVLKIASGHCFIVFMKDCYPINVLNTIKNIPEVCTIFCATANPTKIVIAQTKNNGEIGRGILGVIDGFSPKGLENPKEIAWRKQFLRDIGYKQ